MLEFFIIINFFLLIAFVLFLISKPAILTYLIITEFIWIFLYLLTLVLGIPSDSIYLLTINFFILIFSGLEFALGLLIYYFF